MSRPAGARTHPQTSSFYFSVHAESEASTLPRVLGVLAKRGLVPERLNSSRLGQDEPELHIDFKAIGLDRESADLLAQELRRIVLAKVVLMVEG